tara:strand:- start:48 stop:530 length:483 start_codon:yes stop_codon:yes gene_type:complete
MANSLNKVTLVGNIGRDPEVRSFQNGSKVCNLSLATSERWKDKETNEPKEKTEWHRIVVFNDKLVEIIEKYVHKGSKVYIEGQLETRKWTDASGTEKYSTEVVLRPYRGEIIFLDSKSEVDNSSSDVIEDDNVSSSKIENESSNNSVEELASDLDDDIPF